MLQKGLQINNVIIVPFLYSTDFQVLVPSSMYCTHCIHTVLHPLILRVCYNTVLLYISIFNFLHISLQIFPLNLSVIIPYSFKADLALIHVEGSRLIRDRYLELCRIPNSRGLLQGLVNVVRS